jgi:hypothetical protein
METLIQRWLRTRAGGRPVDEPYLSQVIGEMARTRTFYTVTRGLNYVDERGRRYKGPFKTVECFILLQDQTLLHADIGPAKWTILADNEEVDDHWYKFGICTDRAGIIDDEPTDVLEWIINRCTDFPAASKYLVSIGAEVSEDLLLDAARNDLPCILDSLLPHQTSTDLLTESVSTESMRVLNYLLQTGRYTCDEVSNAIVEDVGFSTEALQEWIETSARHAMATDELALVQCLLRNGIESVPFFAQSMMLVDYELLFFLLENGLTVNCDDLFFAESQGLPDNIIRLVSRFMVGS